MYFVSAVGEGCVRIVSTCVTGGWAVAKIGVEVAPAVTVFDCGSGTVSKAVDGGICGLEVVTIVPSACSGSSVVDYLAAV